MKYVNYFFRATVFCGLLYPVFTVLAGIVWVVVVLFNYRTATDLFHELRVTWGDTVEAVTDLD